MTKKHFIAISKIINKHLLEINNGISTVEHERVCQIVQDLSDYFKGENHHFDKTRFINACKKNLQD